VYFFATFFTPSYTSPVVGTLAKFNQALFGINYMVTILFFGGARTLGDKTRPDYYLGIINHILPFFTIFIEFTFNNHVFFYKNLFVLSLLSSVYTYWNIFLTYLTGKQIYEEINLASVEGFIYSFLITFIGVLGSAFGVWYQTAVKSWIFEYEELNVNTL
jgi:hypothetical protein